MINDSLNSIRVMTILFFWQVSNRRSRRWVNDRILLELVPRLNAEEIRGLFAPPPWGTHIESSLNIDVWCVVNSILYALLIHKYKCIYHMKKLLEVLWLFELTYIYSTLIFMVTGLLIFERIVHFHLPDTLVKFWPLIFFNSFDLTARNWEVCVDSTTLLKNLISELALVWMYRWWCTAVGILHD